MSWLDIAILIVLAISGFAGLKNGLIKTVISFVGLIIGINLAGRFYPALATRLTFLPQGTVANIAAFVIIFLVIMVVSGIIATVLTRVASAILLGWLNHLAGGAFGVVMGALICGALLALWLKYSGPSPTITRSLLAGILLDKLPIVLSLLPADFGSIRQFFH